MKQQPCKWCGELTSKLGTQECDGCWELRSRIESDIELADKMLRAIQEGSKVDV